MKILHIADIHLDSAFEGLSAYKAAKRRSEQRELLLSVAELVKREEIDLVLMPGDIFDSGNTYYETGEALEQMLEMISVPVFLAPGNHDFFAPSSPYAKLKKRENVHIFTKTSFECVELEKLKARVFGAAFTDNAVGPDIEAMRVDSDGETLNILCAHAQVGYDPVNERALGCSGLDYAALGHIHKPSGLRRSGDTYYSWPGCPEGRGFDELGDRFVNIVTLEKGSCTMETRSIQKRRYMISQVDITDIPPLLAIHNAVGDGTANDIYRIILTGEVEEPVNTDRLCTSLSDMFFQLQIRDNTRLKASVWDKAGEDTLRGLFLKKLQEQFNAAQTDEQRALIEHSAMWGLAALDNMEEVVSHENK